MAICAADPVAPWAGKHTIEAVAAPGMILEAVGSGTTDGTIVSINHNSKAPNQLWEFVAKGSGFYSIRPSYSDKIALTVLDAGTQDGTQIVVSTDKGADDQLWSVKTNSNGTFSICPKHAPAEGIDDWGGGTDPGSKQDIWAWSDGDPHLQWKITPATGAATPASPPAAVGDAAHFDGEQFIEPAGTSGMLLEVVGGANVDGTIVSINTANGNANQKWVVSDKGDGYCTISPSNAPGLVLSVAGGGTSDGSQLIISIDKGQPSQLWAIKKAGRRTFNILTKSDPSKGIDDYAGGSTPGSKQDIWQCIKGNTNLQWRISNAKEGLPKSSAHGQLINAVFDQSKIYPGTRRSVNIYVPAQYNAAKPACVYVQQDGGGKWEPNVLDQLMADGVMPVTVGVFVTPGGLGGPNGSGRQNRNFEYDAIGDDYVRFIVDELLPWVAKTYNLNLSTSGNDRCISGASSGGICAFNAAWHRPDAFTRVYANSPSLVAFRGGNDYQDFIRKFEPKPIRTYMTCGSHDMVNCAGDWTEIINQFATSMSFSGYDYFFQQLDGGHVAGWGPDQMADALTFLWKDWPEPIKPGIGAPRYQDIVAPGEGWRQVAQDLTGATVGSGNSKGEVFFTEDGGKKIGKIGLDGAITTYVDGADSLSSLSVGANDEIFASSLSTGKIVVYDAAGKASDFATGIPGQFVFARPQGGAYVSSPGAPGQPGSLWLVTSSGKVLVDTAGKLPTGLAMTSDRWLLDMADGASKWIYSYQVNDDGTLTNKERYFRLYVPDDSDDAGIQTLCYDKEDHLYAATRLGIQICAEYGPVQVILPSPGPRITGLAFGGPDQNTLFAFCGDKIYARKVKGHELGAFTPVTRMKFGQL